MANEQHQHDQWFIPAGSRPEAGWTDVVDGRIEGWAHTGLRTGAVADGGELRLPADAVLSEVAVLGDAVLVDVASTTQPASVLVVRTDAGWMLRDAWAA